MLYVPINDQSLSDQTYHAVLYVVCELSCVEMYRISICADIHRIEEPHEGIYTFLKTNTLPQSSLRRNVYYIISVTRSIKTPNTI